MMYGDEEKTTRLPKREEGVGSHDGSFDGNVGLKVGNVTELWGAAGGGVAVTSEVQPMQVIKLLADTSRMKMTMQ